MSYRNVQKKTQGINKKGAGAVAMQSAVRNAMMSTSEDQLKAIFKRLDANQDGAIGLFELKNAFKEVGAPFPVAKAFQALIHADTNKDGKLTLDEMEKLVKYIFLEQGYSIK